MIKQMLEYTDIEGQRTTRTVMFNLTQFEIEGEMELELIQARFQRFQDEVIGNDPNAPLREMTGPEKREILGMVKELVRHSYGVKDGKRFIKDKDVWDDFEQTGAFSAFIYWLFDKPERANAFMSGIWPQGVDRPEDEPRPDLTVVPDTVQGEVIENAPDDTPSIESPGYLPERDRGDSFIRDSNGNSWAVKENLWDYGEKELIDMSDGEFEAVKKKFTQGRNVPLPLLQVGGKRKEKQRG
jgi:hypothetical protein